DLDERDPRPGRHQLVVLPARERRQWRDRRGAAGHHRLPVLAAIRHGRHRGEGVDRVTRPASRVLRRGVEEMKTLFRRLHVPSVLRRKWVVMPAIGVLALLLLGGVWFLGHSGANTVWNQPSVPISDVLDRVDHGQIATASITGQRILLMDTSGRQSWTIEEESSMGATEQYLRGHNVKVAVQSTDETSVATVLPNLLGLLVLLALLFMLLRRSNLLGNPMGAMTKH